MYAEAGRQPRASSGTKGVPSSEVYCLMLWSCTFRDCPNLPFLTSAHTCPPHTRAAARTHTCTIASLHRMS